MRPKRTGPAEADCGRFRGECGGGLVEAVEPGSVTRTDRWPSHARLRELGSQHQKAVTGGDPGRMGPDFPRVHRVAARLKRWLLGTHQGAVERQHLDALSGRFHRPLQPQDFPFAGPAVLSLAAASGRDRPSPAQDDSRRLAGSRISRAGGPPQWSTGPISDRNVLGVWSPAPSQIPTIFPVIMHRPSLGFSPCSAAGRASLVAPPFHRLLSRPIPG